MSEKFASSIIGTIPLNGIYLHWVGLVLCITLYLSSISAAAEGEPFAIVDNHSINATTKILDRIAVRLSASPDQKVILVLHPSTRGTIGEGLRYLHRARQYLIDARGISQARIVLREGESRPMCILEAWLDQSVLSRSTLHVPSAWQVKIGVSPKLIDQYSFDEFGWGPYIADDSVRFSYLEDLLRANPGMRICLIGYGLRLDEYKSNNTDGTEECVGLQDAKHFGLRIAEYESRVLRRIVPAANGRVDILDGGHRTGRTVEVWARLETSPLPTPSPGAFGPLPVRRCVVEWDERLLRGGLGDMSNCQGQFALLKDCE